MRVSHKAVIQSLIVAIGIFMSQPLLAETIYLFGKIGDFPIGASLDRDEEKLTGWYFYHSRAKKIRLEGNIDRHGTFRIEETAGGEKTGIFEGGVKQGRWIGTWRKTVGAATLPLALEENRNQLQNSTGRYDCTAKERDAQHHYTYQWKLKLALADGVVKELAADQGAYGDGKDEQTCSIGLKDLKQVASAVGILLQPRNADSIDEKCSVRVLGDTDSLWIRFGDSSEEGNDCRGAGSTMFCSPRAFWNDVIVDRRTLKCRAPK